MGIVLDVIIIAILILSIFMGYKKGLIGVVFNLCAFLVALIITWILYNPITNMVIENTEIDEGIRNTIVEKFSIEDKSKEKNSGEKQDAINNYIQEYVANPMTDKANDAIDETAKVISQKVVAIGVAIALFIVVRIALILLKFVAEGIANLPLIKQCNKIGGLFYGAVRGFFVIYIAFAILFFVMSINNSGVVAETINSSIISKYLYAHNIILDIIF